MNRVSGFIIIIIGALVRISEYHIILDILIKSRYTAVQYRGTQPKYCGIPRYIIFRGTQHYNQATGMVFSSECAFLSKFWIYLECCPRGEAVITGHLRLSSMR